MLRIKLHTILLGLLSKLSIPRYQKAVLFTGIVLLLATGSGCVTQEKYRLKENELLGMTQKFEKQQEETETIKQKYEESLKAMQEMQQALGEKDGVIKERDHLIQEKDNALDETKKILEEKENETERLRTLQKDAENEAEALSYRIKKLTEQLELKKQEVLDLAKTTETLEAKIEEYNSELAILTAKYGSNKAENEKLNTEKKRLQSRVFDLSNDLNDHKIKLVFLKNERDSLASIIEAVRYLVADAQVIHNDDNSIEILPSARELPDKFPPPGEKLNE